MAGGPGGYDRKWGCADDETKAHMQRVAVLLSIMAEEEQAKLEGKKPWSLTDSFADNEDSP